MGERDGQERAAWDGGATAARQSGCAVSGRKGRAGEGHRVAEGQRRADDAVDTRRGGRMRAAVEKLNVAVFFYFF